MLAKSGFSALFAKIGPTLECCVDPNDKNFEKSVNIALISLLGCWDLLFKTFVHVHGLFGFVAEYLVLNLFLIL